MGWSRPTGGFGPTESGAFDLARNRLALDASGELSLAQRVLFEQMVARALDLGAPNAVFTANTITPRAAAPRASKTPRRRKR